MAPTQFPTYTNAPAALVVLEVTYPEVAELSGQVLAELRSRMRPAFPIYEPLEQSVHTFNPLASPQTSVETMTVPRFSTRDRSAGVVVSPRSMVIETTAYVGFESYCDFIREPLAVVAEVLRPDAVNSIGHRYIDEVRVPSASDPIEWTDWLDDSLFCTAHLLPSLGFPAALAWQGLISFRHDEESVLTLRYGPATGHAVDPGGPTRRVAAPPPGMPYFLLDWDSRWTPSTSPEFEVEAVVSRCASLYEPVRAMFHQLISDRLRSALNDEGSSS